jgi:hypothetical protein
MTSDSLLLGTGTIASSGTATGVKNVIIGNNTAAVMTNAGSNVIIGDIAGAALTSASNCVFIGSDAGKFTTTNSSNTCIGYLSSTAVGLTQSSAFGHNAICTIAGVKIGSNTANVVLGGQATTVTVGNLITLTGITPTITTSATGGTAILSINTIAGGGTIQFNPKGVYAFQIDSNQISTNVELDMGTKNISNANTITGTGLLTSGSISTGTVGCGSVTSSGTLTMSNATLANRIINNVFYNLVNLTTGANSVIYADGTNIYYDGRVNSGNHTFTTKNNLGVSSNPLQITSLGITLAPPVTMSSTLSVGGILNMTGAGVNKDINNINYAKAAQLSIGTQSDALGQNTTTMYMLGTGVEYLNQALNGSQVFKTRDGAGNSISSLTLSPTAVTIQNNITLTTTAPVLGSSPAQFTQLGGCNYGAFGTATALATTVYRIIANSGTLATPVSLPVGTYLMTGSVTFNNVIGGVVTRIGCAFNTASGAFPPVDTQLSTGTEFTNNSITYTAGSVTYLNSSCVVTVTTAAVYYFIAQYQAVTATFTVGGSASFTRIA